MSARILQGDARERLEEMAADSADMVCTSPPYWALRRYNAGPQEMGSEASAEEYLEGMVAVFREVRRVLKPTGTCWVNVGDTYNANTGAGFNGQKTHDEANRNTKGVSDVQPGNLLGIPERLALALQADGWVWRSTVVWCLSGGTWVYARTQKGDMPVMLRDLVRLKPDTVHLWNGERWTRMLGISRTPRQSAEIELVLRSGERISATPNHRFPTERGLLEASEIVVGDKLIRVKLPEADRPKDSEHIGLEAAWLAGMYLAEGSHLQDKGLVIAGRANETERYERIKAIAESYGGSATWSTDGNNSTIRIYGKVVVALVLSLLTGRTALDKGINPVVWRYSNAFLKSFLMGYLEGDGHWEPDNNRWRLGFCRNYNLERDLRTLCGRLGIHLTLRISKATYQGGEKPSFRGELRFGRSGHWNEKDVNEVIEIRNARARHLYDVGVEDDPHVFALASGVLTHNSKPAPMPESTSGWEWAQHQVKVRERPDDNESTSHGERYQGAYTRPQNLATWSPCPGCSKCEPNGGLVLRKGSWRPTRSFEYLYQFTKGMGAWANQHAVMEEVTGTTRPQSMNGAKALAADSTVASKWDFHKGEKYAPPTRNPRSVQTWGPQPQHGDPGKGYTPPVDTRHFAAYPVALAGWAIRASCPERVCMECGAPWAPVVERTAASARQKPGYLAGTGVRNDGERAGSFTEGYSRVLGLRPTCGHDPERWQPGLVLDPFCGTGTTLLAASRLGRRSVGIELSTAYVALAEARLRGDAPLLAEIAT